MRTVQLIESGTFIKMTVEHVQQLSDKPQKDFKDFLWLPNFVFKFIGYNVLVTKTSRLQCILQWTLFFSLLALHMFDKYFMYKQTIELIRKGDIMNVVRTSSYVAYSIDANIKFLAINLNLKRARLINTKLEQAFPCTQNERKLYKVNEHYWERSTIIVIWIYFIATTAIVFVPLLQSIYQFNNAADDATFPYYKPIPMEYWYNYRTVPLYVLTYFMECAYILFTTITNVGTDLWLIHDVTQICMHLKFIQNILIMHKPSQHHFKRDCDILSKLIRKHQLMFFLIAELNKIFGISLAFTLLSTTGLLCVMAVQLSIEKLSTFFFVLLTYICMVLLQFALVCKYGQQLINESGQIAIAAYEHDIYDTSKEYKKMILIIMLRAQKQGQISAKAFQPISIETLKMVVSMTYRIFAVVQTLIN